MRTLLDLVLPVACAGCGRPGVPACPGCLSPLRAPPRWTCPVPAPPGLPPVATVAAYAGATRELVVGYKDDGRTALRVPLGQALASSAAFASSLACGARAGPPLRPPPCPPLCPPPCPPVWLVAVPSSAAACRRRGADVVADLAVVAARTLRRTGTDVEVLRALRRVRPVADSAGLDARARAANATGSIGVRAGVVGALHRRPVVLVDDLVTTGVSLAEAARALREAGARVVAAATVAATVRRHGG